MLIGITPDGRITGQHVSDNTQRDVAAMLCRLEPAAPVEFIRIPLPNGCEVLALEAKPSLERAPFLYEGRPYHRIGSTTSVMPQSRYEELLLERAATHSRWETLPAAGFGIDQLDQEVILRIVRLGIEKKRLPESTGTNVGDILDRLGLREKGRLLNAAVVLFGKGVFPAYSQCHLRLARFRGNDKSEFLDERQIYGHAFNLLEEATLFLDRHLPVRKWIETGRLERIDEPLFPPAALREALVNALCHRDYSLYSGAINVAIFDDRVEIWSDGKLPFGLRPSDLTRNHASKPRNLTITDLFYRCGYIEQWGRGTQKIIELCTHAGHPEPKFAEVAGSVVVTFRPASGSISPTMTEEVTTEVTEGVTMEVAKLLALSQKPIIRRDLQMAFGLRHEEHFREAYLAPALTSGLLEMTVPDKPNSRLQKYRLTAKGRSWLKSQSKV